jgi:hypothetical protein
MVEFGLGFGFGPRNAWDLVSYGFTCEGSEWWEMGTWHVSSFPVGFL